jgi:hypothetical protein
MARKKKEVVEEKPVMVDALESSSDKSDIEKHPKFAKFKKGR